MLLQLCVFVAVCCSVAWSGGDMVTNKLEALRKFVERKGGIHALTEAQRALIRVANASHTKLSVPVAIVPTAVLTRSPAMTATPQPVETVPVVVLPGQKRQALKRQHSPNTASPSAAGTKSTARSSQRRGTLGGPVASTGRAVLASAPAA